MLQYLYKIFFHLNDTVTIFVSITSVMSGLAALYGMYRQKKSKVQKGYASYKFWICLFVVSVIVFCGILGKHTLREVPNVVGYTYQSAYETLVKGGLGCSPMNDRNVYIMGQNPPAGSIVHRGTVVQLIVSSIESGDYVTISGAGEQISIQNENVWKSIEVHFMLNNYERMLEIAEENQLMESEQMLNILGVMYAQGLYYERDPEKALIYLKAATTYGELERTYTNLWLASYIADIEAAEDNNILFNNCFEALKVAEIHNNNLINEMLRTGIYVCYEEIANDGYEYMRTLDFNEKRELLKTFRAQSSTQVLYLATQYDYLADISTNASTGEKTYSNVKAFATEIQEVRIPIYVFASGSPMEYQLFENLTQNPVMPYECIVTGEFKYDLGYTDVNGKVVPWKDTNEIFYGDEPPEEDENSRWVIMSYDEIKKTRVFRKQVKE